MKWKKQGPEMGQEVAAPMDGVAQGTRSEQRWMLSDWVCRYAFYAYAAEYSAEFAVSFLQ